MRILYMVITTLVLPGPAMAQIVKLEVVPAKTTAIAGQDVRFTIRATDSSGSAVASIPKALWLVGPGDVAVVVEDGLIRTLRQGSARVLARVGGIVASAELVIEPKPPATIELVAEPGSAAWP